MGIESIRPTEQRANDAMQKKQKKIADYRKEVSRRASMANKRLKRLEESGISTPAFDKWRESGGEYFSVRGKTYNEVQAEMARVNQYLDNATSSISGAKKVMNDMIINTGIKIDWKDLTDVQNKAKQFFEIASKIEQYLRTVEDIASSVGYQKIWEAINRYVKDHESALDESKTDAEQISQNIVKSMKEWEKTDKFESRGNNFHYWQWAKLDKK